MKYTDFIESNFTYTAPKDSKNCGDLKVYRQADPDNPDTMFIWSCWEITPEEILEVLMTKRIWLQLHFPVQPPIALFADSPFDGARTEAQKSAKLDGFKRRLIQHFLSEEFGAAQAEISDRIPMIEELLDGFLSFVMKRGEK